MLESIESLLTRFLPVNLGERALGALAVGAALLLLAVLAALSYVVAKRLLLRVVAFAVARTKTDWDDRLLRHRVFFWLTHLAPGAVLFRFAPTVLEGAEGLGAGIRIGAQVYLIVVGLLVVDALLNALLEIYNTFSVSREIPLKGLVQVAKIVLYLTTLLIVVATFLGESPIVLLSGLGVLASVLMLVFKDAILGFVAGIQLSTNRMLSKGDWLEMPSYGADGDVVDIALTTVKVQNFDKTITTIPTYALISQSFKNWRGMAESGGRRIKRSVVVDMGTIRLCTEGMIERYSEIRYIAAYVERKRRELREWNAAQGVEHSSIVNQKHLTNVGTFRAYLVAYLKNHPEIHQEMTLLVRQLAPTPDGLPIEIYCFTRDTAWARYESIQADIMDHVLAIAPEFDLRVFQRPSGGDLAAASRHFGDPPASA
ncbi:MAG: mechanosensitive ion channel domain-containing protein [Acidobacteriota bacterium]